MILSIRNMVCNRCVIVVQQEFVRLGMRPEKVFLGEVILPADNISTTKLKELDASLLRLGFERIGDRKARIIESIKNKIISVIHHSTQVELKFNWSTILSEATNYEYSYISILFSRVEGITLEQYIIRQKIEKVKELLFYDELSLSEIADRLGYSSVAHLSSQFKKVTRFTPSELKKSRELGRSRKPLDSIL